MPRPTQQNKRAIRRSAYKSLRVELTYSLFKRFFRKCFFEQRIQEPSNAVLNNMIA